MTREHCWVLASNSRTKRWVSSLRVTRGRESGSSMRVRIQKSNNRLPMILNIMKRRSRKKFQTTMMRKKMNRRSKRSHKAARLAMHSNRSKKTIRAMRPLLTKLITKTSDGLRWF